MAKCKITKHLQNKFGLKYMFANRWKQENLDKIYEIKSKRGLTGKAGWKVAAEELFRLQLKDEDKGGE